MSESKSPSLTEALRQRPDAIFYHLTSQITEAFPTKALLECDSTLFDLRTFAHEGHCSMTENKSVPFEWEWNWREDHGTWVEIYNGALDVTWNGQSYLVLTIGKQEAYCRSTRHYIIAETKDSARALYTTVCKWNSEVRGEVLVFDEGHWSKSADLFKAIQAASMEDLILEKDLKETFVADVKNFFQSKEIYDRYGIAWKRGILLLGPPGNGKTHILKAIVNSSDLPCLYVKSFTAQHYSDQANIGNAFRRAREAAPCIFILEDLDAIINDDNRSFFLNEMDGFASNSGILTLATTNHPERLDPAILDRPSRFDRKYEFCLPGENERIRYLLSFSQKLQPELKISEKEAVTIAAATTEYSFAYLKELYLSSMMAWISKPGESICGLMVAQAETLRAQMANDPGESITVSGESEDPYMMVRQMMRGKRKRN